MCRVRHVVLLTALIASVVVVLSACATVSTGQHPYSSVVKVGAASSEFRYLLYLPAAYGADHKVKWPLILYLHGYGERGSNLELLKKHPLPQALEARSDFPFIVVSPQLEEIFYEWDSRLEMLNALVFQIQGKYAVDSARIYVTGLSMGGAGAWKMALRFPHRFAAAVPVAGFYTFESKELPPNICALKDLPVWAFHGSRDTTVLPYQDEIIVAALRACGSDVKYTVYDGAEHEDTWRKAYADPALFEWMLSQRLR